MKKYFFVKSNYLVEIEGKDVSVYKEKEKDVSVYKEKEKEVSVYKEKEKEVSVYKEKEKENFNLLVKKYKIQKIFIGKIPPFKFKRKISYNWFWNLFLKEEEEEKIQVSEEYQKKLEGNTILLKIKKNKYVKITNLSVSEFTVGNDRIIDYISPVEENDISYPIATGEKYFYFLFDDSKILKEKIPEKIQKNSFSMIDYIHTDVDRELITNKIIDSSIN